MTREFDKMKNLLCNLTLVILSLCCNFFNLAEKDKFTQLKLHDYSRPKVMLINNDETLMVTIATDASISFWDMNEKKQVLKIEPFVLKDKFTNYLEAEFVGREKYIAAFYKEEEKLFFFDIAKKKIIKERSINFEYASFSRNSDLIALGRDKKKYIEVRNVFDWSLKCFLNLKGTSYRYEFSKEGKYLAVAIDHNSVFMYDVGKCKEMYSISFPDVIYKVSIFEKEAKLIVSHYPNYINIIDLNTGMNIKNWQAHAVGAISLAFSPDGQYIATGGYDDDVSIWNRKDFSFVKSIHFAQIFEIYYTKDSKSIFMKGYDNRILIWDLTKEKFYLEAHPPIKEGEK
jgi:WD40 repeat protein